MRFGLFLCGVCKPLGRRDGNRGSAGIGKRGNFLQAHKGGRKMKVLAVLNILFALSAGCAGMAKMQEMRNCGMFDMENFCAPAFTAAAAAFALCALAILAFEKPFVKYLYALEILLYFAMCSIMAAPLAPRWKTSHDGRRRRKILTPPSARRGARGKMMLAYWRQSYNRLSRLWKRLL